MASGGLVGNSCESEEKFDMLCSSCKEQNKNKEAEKYCVDCQDYYCSECLKLHSTLPALRGHKLLDKEAGQSGELLMVPTERCERHNFKIVDMFCQNHDVIGCGTCIAVDHRECKDVFYIPEYVKSKADALPEFLKRMTNIDNKFKEFLKTFGDEVEALKANKTKEIETIKAFAKKLQDKIKEAERDVISKVEERYEKLMVKINGDIDEIRRELETFETTRGFIESTIENTSQAFVAMKLNGNKIATTEAASDDITQIKLGRRVHFMLDPNLEEMSKERMCLGNVNLLPYSFEHKGEVDLKLHSDSNTCNVYGSCVLSDGSIVFADRDNKTIKLVDGTSLTVIDHHDLTIEPWDMCCLDNKDIAVCLTNENKIKIFKVDHKLYNKYELSFRFVCIGISYCNNILYISDFSNLYMCNVDGSMLKRFASDISFSNIYNILVSKHSKNIFVNDRNHGEGVICLDSQGNISQITSNEIKGSNDLANAHNGKVFVCGISSRNVILLNESGAFESIVIEESVAAPHSLCFNCNNGCLYITSYKTDNVQIFELQ